jgi:hypothetical protein
MRHLKSAKSNEVEATSIATIMARRYCNRCHLSTPKANPRCIHCRCVQATDVLGDRIERRVA